MKPLRIFDLIITAGGVLLFFFLLIQSQRIDDNRHDAYAQNLRLLEATDAKLNESILQIRLGLLEYYDAPQQHIRAIEALQVDFANVPAYVPVAARNEVARALDETEARFEQKGELLNRFSSQHAVLNNSRVFFPLLVTELTSSSVDEGVAQELRTALNRLAQNVLVFDQTGNDSLIPRIDEDIATLRANSNAFPELRVGSDIVTVINHAEIIVERKPLADSLLSEMLAVPTLSSSENLNTMYNTAYLQAVSREQAFQQGLTLYAVIVVITIATRIIYQLRESAQAVDLAREKYEGIFNNSAEGIFQASLQGAGNFVSANPALAQMFGFDTPNALMDEVKSIGQQLFVDPNTYKEFYTALCKHDEVTNFEAEVYRRDGRVIWIAENARLMRDQNGKPAYYEGAVREITRQKILERQSSALFALTRALTTATTENELLYTMSRPARETGANSAALFYVVENALDGDPITIELAAEWQRFVRADSQMLQQGAHLALQQFPKMLESMIRTRTTLLIGNVAEDPRLGPESRAWLAQLEAEALAIIPLLQQDHWVGVTIFYWGQPHTFSETEEVVFGALPALASTAVANRRLVVNLERRVSERTEEIEEKNVQLQHSMEAAQAANHAKSLFLAKMSHELRTPLNAILGFTQLMQRDLSMSHTQQDQLNIINDSGVQLLGLINDVLDFSKIEAGQMAINRVDFDLYQLVHSLEKMLYVQAHEKGIHLTVDIGVEVPRFIRADEGKIRQVLMNLLSNAVKFTHVGGVTLQMRADEDAERVRLRCDVCDTGVGIAVEEYDNLFDAFSQTTSGKNLQKGTGLGLAISHKFAEMMQGDIFVESTEGEGSIFTFTVVVEHGDPAFVRTDAPREQVVRLADSQRMPRVLIVEDNLENRLLLKQLLEPIGFDLREAENGQVALEIVEDWKPEAILLDMLMPVMDGFETIRRIRQLPLAPQPCVIAITASAFEHDRDAILAEGCDDFIGKPFVQHILLEKLQAQLGLSYTYRTLEQSNRFLADAPDLTSSDFSGLPLVWLHAANEAAVAADYQQLLDLADEIEDQSIASRLRELVQEFDFETIARATTT